MINLLLRSAADMADLSSSDPPLDSKQQRKLRQQQLQQKFRQEMEAKNLLQKQSNASAEQLPLQSKQGVMENLRVHVLAMSIKDSSLCLQECQVCSALHRWVCRFRTGCRSC